MFPVQDLNSYLQITKLMEIIKENKMMADVKDLTYQSDSQPMRLPMLEGGV